MEDAVRTEETPRIEINSQIANEFKSTGQKSCVRILHVDDDPCILEVSKQILATENNFEIDGATSVDEAFRKMEKQTYDVIVSDYEMPIKNGLDFLKELKKQQKTVPFVLFTGKGREEVVVEALNLGADSYINKHGSPETVYCELADAINKTVEREKSREQLARSESKYRALVENSLQGISILLVAPLRIVFANGAFGKILGYSSQDLMSLSPEGIMGLVFHEDRAVFFKRMENRLRGEPSESGFEFRAVRKNGSLIWLSSLAHRVDYDGQPAVQGMFLDVDESKKAGENLRESEHRYRELANSLPDIVFETDTTGKLEFVNNRALEIAGYSNEDFEKGLNIMQFLAPEDRQKAMKSIQRLLAGGRYVPSEYVFLRKNGTTFPALITTTLRISKNKVTGLRGLVIDITERKKAEDVVRKSEERYRELANSLPEIVFETDLTGKITFFSQRALEISGFSREELENGLNMLSFVVPEERERAMENMKKSMAGKDLGSNEYMLLRKDGATYPALVRTTPIIYENNVTGLRGLVIDITEQKKAEEKIRVASLYSRSLLEASLDPLVTINAEGKITDVNKAAEEVTGFAREELIGSDFSNYFTESEKARAGYRKVFTEGYVKDYLLAIRHKSGRITDVLYNASVYRNEVGEVRGVFAAARDVTERKKAEKALQESELKFRTIADFSHNWVYWLAPDGIFVYVSPSCEKITGYTAEEFIKDPKLLTRIISPQDSELVGPHFDLFSEKMAHIVEFRIKNKSGETRWISHVCDPVFDHNGKWLGRRAANRDITERKEAEEKLKEDSIRMEMMNEKLRVVGSLTRHDVRNKLCAVTANAFMVKKKHADQPDIMDGLGKMEQAVKDVVKILDFAKTYEELGVEELTYIDVEKKLNDSVGLFSGSFNIEVINDCHGLTLLADSFLRQLFYNLIDNSLKHGEKVTRIRVHYEKVGQDKLNVVYEDDGVGIPAVNKPNLFKEGFTTGGSGYGLNLIKKMIEVYGWAIQENGEPEKGARFTITIPKINQKGKENFQIAP